MYNLELLQKYRTFLYQYYLWILLKTLTYYKDTFHPFTLSQDPFTKTEDDPKNKIKIVTDPS